MNEHSKKEQESLEVLEITVTFLTSVQLMKKYSIDKQKLIDAINRLYK